MERCVSVSYVTILEMVGEIHCHTNLSYPRWFHRHVPTPKELVDYALKLKLDFVAITDHDCNEAFGVIQEYALKKGLVVIPASEITTDPTHILRRRAHILAYGITEDIPSRLSVSETIERIHSQNGLAVVAHPFCTKYAKVLYIGHQAGDYDFDGVEVFNSDEVPADNIRAKALATVLSLPGYAGSDAHSLQHLGSSLIKVNIPKTKDWRKIVDALRERNFEIVKESYLSLSWKGKLKYFILRRWPLPILP